jgi:hypothetical protein
LAGPQQDIDIGGAIVGSNDILVTVAIEIADGEGVRTKGHLESGWAGEMTRAIP